MSPERLTMQSPGGTSHMVLARDRAKFEARGYTYVSAYGGEPVPLKPIQPPAAPAAPEIRRSRKA